MKIIYSILCCALGVFLAGAQTPATNTAPAAATADYEAQLRQRVQAAAAATNSLPTAPNFPPRRSGTNIAFPAFPAVTAPGTTPAPGALAPGTTATEAAIAGNSSLATTNKIVEEAKYFWNAEFPLEQALEEYATLVGRTILRASAGAPSAPNTALRVIMKINGKLTRSEAIAAWETVLGMNGITMIPIGEKFVKVVNEATAGQAGGEFSNINASELPDSGRFVTYVVQLKFAQVSEVQNAIAPFAKGIQSSVVPIPSSQTIVIRDYTENVKRMLEVIDKIDIIPPSNIKPEVIPIKYAIADDIAQVLGSLTSSGAGVSVGRSGQTRGGTTPQPGAVPGAVNPITGQPNQAPPAAANNLGRSSAFQQRLQGIIRAAAGSSEFQILGQTKIISDARTNSLLIFADDTDMKMIKEIIDKLDVVLAQVLIEAIIMEVSLDDGRNIGVSMQQRAQQMGKLTTAGGENNGQNFLGSLTNLASGANGLPSGFSYFGTYGKDFDFAVTAIATDSRVNVLQRPRIQTSHAVPANLFIGETVPYIQGTISDINGGARSQYQQTQIGITLNVTPLINPDGLVVMDIEEKIQQLGTPTTIDGNAVPTTTDRNASAKVAVRDGDTIILGGFISTTQSRTKSGIPWLKDIPIIGAAFRTDNKSRQRVELIAMIRPTVLKTPEAAAVQATSEKNRLPGVRAAEAEITRDERKQADQLERQIQKMNERDAAR